MCKCCRRIRAWCKAFTRLEGCLTCVECVLLTALVPLVVLLVLHMIACASPLPEVPAHEPEAACTWTPGVKTESVTMYFDKHTIKTTTPVYKITQDSEGILVMVPDGAEGPDTAADGTASPREEEEDLAPFGRADEEEASEEQKASTLALVKLQPPRGVVFGCMLTVVGRFWALTTASCVEAVEEVDSLDSYSMVEEYGGRARTHAHAVADLRVHPHYRRDNASYDAAALRSPDSLLRAGLRPARLAAGLQLALLVPGERLQVLAYGPFRGAGAGRRLAAGGLHVAAGGACAAGGGALRHLWAGRRGGAACAGGAGARCAGAAGGAGGCAACGGAGVWRRGRLLALAPRDAPCGEACDPFWWRPAARLRPWLDTFVRGE